MKNICIIFLIVVSFGLSSQETTSQLPVLDFTVRAMPNTQEISPLIEEYLDYANDLDGALETPQESKWDSTPNQMPKLLHLFNGHNSSLAEEQKYFWCLSNPKFIEAILAKKYTPSAYVWVLGANDQVAWTLNFQLQGYTRGQDLENSYFFGITEQGKQVQFSYDYLAKNLQYLEFGKTVKTWEISLVEERLDKEQKTFYLEKAGQIIKAASLKEAIQKAITQAQKDNPTFGNDLNKLKCQACYKPQLPQNISPKNFNNFTFSIRMDKYKRSSSDKIGHVIVTPHVNNSSVQANGLTFHLYEIKPLQCKGYRGDQYDQCGGFSSRYVPHVAVSFTYYVRPDGIQMRSWLSQYSTCNVRQFSYSTYKYPAIVVGFSQWYAY